MRLGQRFVHLCLSQSLATTCEVLNMQALLPQILGRLYSGSILCSGSACCPLHRLPVRQDESAQSALPRCCLGCVLPHFYNIA